MKEAIGRSPQEQSRDAKDRTLGHHSVTGSPGVRADSAACNTHMPIAVLPRNEFLIAITLSSVLGSCRIFL